MLERYPNGTRVIVRLVPQAAEFASAAWLYEALAGEIVGANMIANCALELCDQESNSMRRIFLEEYSVLLDTGIQLDHISEDCVERIFD